MTLTQTFIGSFLEVFSLCYFMSIFNEKYKESLVKLIIITFIVALITTATDVIYIPVGYIINYVSLILLLVLILHLNLFSVLFEFLFGLAALAIFQLFLLFVTSFFTEPDHLIFPIRVLHLVIMMILSIAIGNSKKIHMLVRPFYEKYMEIIYLVAGNLFLFMIVQLYLWDSSNHEIFLESIGVLTVFVLLWCCINGYLFLKLIDNQRKNKLIEVHKQYFDMTENLLHNLYAEKHEFKRHLQTIEGMTYIESSTDAVNDIQEYILGIEKENNRKAASAISFNTGDSVINGLLYTKFNEAKQNDINFFYVPSGTLPKFSCEKFELIEIIGNLMDNAFEYVKNLEPEERKVVLKIEPFEDKSCIQVSNTFIADENTNLSAMTKKGYSTKEGEKRGYGLYNVKRIALKYNGSLNIFTQESQLVVQVLL